MALLDNLNDPTPHKGGKRCRTAILLDKLTEAEADKVREILASIANLEGVYSSSWLASTLKKNGHIINHQTLLRHARKDCCCES